MQKSCGDDFENMYRRKIHSEELVEISNQETVEISNQETGRVGLKIDQV